jgi:hypothetical protein
MELSRATGWWPWMPHDARDIPPSPYGYRQVAIARQEWETPQVVDPRRLHPTTNVVDLWWRPGPSATDRFSARNALRHAVRHAPPPGAGDAQQVQAVFAMVAETLAAPVTLDHAVWASSLLTALRPALTTVAEWQQWGTLATALLEDLVLAYEPPTDP